MKIRKVQNIRSIILCMLLSLPMCMVWQQCHKRPEVQSDSIMRQERALFKG